MDEIYTAKQVAKMTGKTRQAVTRWAQRNPGVGRRLGDIWIFTAADVEVIGKVQPGWPQGKPRTRRAKAPAAAQPSPATQEPTP